MLSVVGLLHPVPEQVAETTALPVIVMVTEMATAFPPFGTMVTVPV
jgi:hypothetical protein